MSPKDWQTCLRDNVQGVRDDLARACERVHRPADAVRLVGVTKYVPVEILRTLVDLGVGDIGESRVQQLHSRAAECGIGALDWPASLADRGLRWHMIGHVQRNKVRQLLTCCRLVHSLDSARLADKLADEARLINARVHVLIEVNVAGEASKAGILPDDVSALVEHVASLPALQLRGLMTMAPYDPDPETSRPVFARLRELRDRLHDHGLIGPQALHLSMGMSQDYVVAVEEGATLVRVGSALFAGLPSNDPRT